MIRALHRWPGLLALALVTASGPQRRCAVGLPGGGAPRRAAGGCGADVAELAQRIQAGLSGRRADQARALWPDHRLLVRQWRAGRCGDRPGHGPGRRLGRSQSRRTLAHQAAPLAVPRRRGPHRDGGGCGGDAGARGLGRVSGGAAGRAAGGAGSRPCKGLLAAACMSRSRASPLPGLLLSSATALWMTASTFDLLPDQAAMPGAPAAVSGKTGLRSRGMDVLARTPVAELRELAFPYPGDATDVFTLKTDRGHRLSSTRARARCLAGAPSRRGSACRRRSTCCTPGRVPRRLGSSSGSWRWACR